MKRLFSIAVLVCMTAVSAPADPSASDYLEEWLEENDLYVGYLPSKKAFVSIGDTTRKVDPSAADFLDVRREMYKIALLEAKRNILLAIEMKVSGKSTVERTVKNGRLDENAENSMSIFASRPLTGARALRSAESMREDGAFQVAVAVVWSPELQKQAKAAGKAAATDAGEKEMRDWLKKQDYAVLVGPRQFVDSTGAFRYLGVGCVPAMEPGKLESDLKKEARKQAQDELVFSVKSDTAVWELSKTGFHTMASADGESTTAWREMLSRIESTIAETRLPGIYDVGMPKRVVHPISGKPVFVAVVALGSGEDLADVFEPTVSRASSHNSERHLDPTSGQGVKSQNGSKRPVAPSAKKTANSEIMNLSNQSASFLRQVFPLREILPAQGPAIQRFKQLVQLRHSCPDKKAADCLAQAIAAGLVSIGALDEFAKIKSMIPDFAAIESKTLDNCRSCDTTGREQSECQSCHGSGRCPIPNCNGGRRYVPKLGVVACPTCKGTSQCQNCRGKGVFQVSCHVCKGTGKVLNKKAAQSYYYECFDEMLEHCRENIVKPVQVHGYGPDEVQAVNNALMEAVGQISGREIQGVQRSENGRLTRDVNVSGSKGSVRRYEIISTKRNDDSSIEVDVIAYVHEHR